MQKFAKEQEYEKTGDRRSEIGNSGSGEDCSCRISRHRAWWRKKRATKSRYSPSGSGLFVVETFQQPRLIPKHLTGSEVPNWESSARTMNSRLGILDVCAGLEASDDGERVAPAIGFESERKRKKKINAAAGGENGGEIEGSGKNADDRDWLIAEGERAADDVGIGSETALPKAVAQHNYLRAIPFAFVGAE